MENLKKLAVIALICFVVLGFIQMDRDAEEAARVQAAAAAEKREREVSYWQSRGLTREQAERAYDSSQVSTLRPEDRRRERVRQERLQEEYCVADPGSIYC